MKRAIFISICLSVVFWSACQRSETTGSIDAQRMEIDQMQEWKKAWAK